MDAPTGKHNTKKVPDLPTEQDLVAFNHSAAGHEGISSNADGSLVIKPCTQAEIDFYESAQEHELFKVHLPSFMGVLQLQPEQSPLKKAIDQTSGMSPIQQMLKTVNNAIAAKEHDHVTPPAASDTNSSSWNPSGGKKLNTGLAIVLENAAAGFKHPNILDVKLGARLWDDDAPEAKRKKLDNVAHQTTSGSLGFRVAGMKLWLGERAASEWEEENVVLKDGYKCFDKNYGRAFDAEHVKDAFVTYLSGASPASQNQDAGDENTQQFSSPRSKLIGQRLLRDLESIQYVLEHQESRMYSASILIVYEGDAEALEVALREEEVVEVAKAENQARGETDGGSATTESAPETAPHADADDEDDDDEEEESKPKVHDVRIIDFAHAKWTPGMGPDENMLQGVRNVIRILKEILA